jgi:Tfp pilus assembly protein FimT
MKKTQNGFTAVEGLLISVIVLIIVGVGWYVLHSVSNANKSLSSADSIRNSVAGKKTTAQPQSSSSSSKKSSVNPVAPASVPPALVSSSPTYVTTTPTIVNNYITINEWNVRAKYSGKVTIVYAHDAHDKNHRSSFFTSSQLSVKNSFCKAVYYPAGYIVRYKTTEHVYGDDGKDSGKTAEQYAGDLAKSSDASSNPFAHAGDYFYFYHGPTGKCDDVKDVDDLQDQAEAAIKTLCQSLEAVPN